MTARTDFFFPVDLSRPTRRMAGWLSIVMLILALAPSRAAAQVPGGDTLRLSYQDLLTRLTSASPELARQRLELERARAARRGNAFFPSFPELEYSVETDAPFENGGEGGWELELTQEIEIGGQYFLRGQAADLSLEQAELEVRAVELTIRAEAGAAYGRLAAAEARLALLDTLLIFSRRLDTIAGRLLAAEEISELDRNAVRIQRGRVELERLAVVGEVSQAGSELAGLLALPPRTLVGALPGSIDASFRSTGLLDTLQRIELALANGDLTVLQRRPDWQALDRARDRVQVERSLASRSWIPNLRVGVGYISETSVLSGEDITGSEHLREEFGELRSTDRLLGLRLGIALPIPLPGLYDLGQAEIALADVELSSATGWLPASDPIWRARRDGFALRQRRTRCMGPRSRR